MVDDPAMGRVLLIAPLSEPVLSGRGIESMPAFVDLVYDQLSEIADPVDKQLVGSRDWSGRCSHCSSVIWTARSSWTVIDLSATASGC